LLFLRGFFMATPLPHKTPCVARQLGISYSLLCNLLRNDRIRPLPKKDSSGDYCWTDADIERLKAALAARRQRRPGSAAHV
jgi:hypothetical protein